MSETRKKIVYIVGGGRFFGTTYPLGGAASYLSTAAKALSGDRFEHVFLFLFDGPSVREFEALGYRCLVVERRDGWTITLPWRIARLLKREQPDVVVTAISNANFYGRIASWLASSPATVTVIMDFLDGIMAGTEQRPWRERFHLWQEKKLWRLCNRLVAVSGPLRQHMVSRWGIPEDRVVTIPGVVDTSLPAPTDIRREKVYRNLGIDPERFLVGSICRLSPVKNLPMLLRAARRVEDAVPGEVCFAVAGEGPQREFLEKEAARMGLSDVVLFTGWCDDKDAFYAAADLHVLTSHSESQGISLLEAMAASRPVIATAVGGVVEVVENEVTGFLVDPEDDEAMARLIVELLRNGTMARNMGMAGRKRVEERFSLEQARSGLEKLLAGLPERAR